MGSGKKPGRFPVFGPVFGYDLTRTARRGTIIAHRCLYAFFLLLALYLVFAFRFPHVGLDQLFQSVAIERREIPRFATQFFNTFLGVQIVAVLLVTPAYVAGAIAEEKQRRTLEFLLATDLRNHEIVLGILSARLANLFLLILTGLPILGILQFLGGVDPNLVLAGFVVTLMTMVSLGCMSILASVFHDRPLEAIFVTYLMMFPFVGTFAMVAWSILAGGLEEASQIGVLLGMLLLYGIYHGLISFFCANWAIWNLRTAYLGTEIGPRREPPPPRKPKRRRRPQAERDWGPFDDANRWDGAGDREESPRPTRPVPYRSPRPPIGDRPMVWKELGPIPEFAVFTGIDIGCIAFAVFLVILFMLGALAHSIGTGESLGKVANPLVRSSGCLVMCASLFFMAMNASGRVSREREQQTLEPLFTTPLDNLDILGAKWLAAVVSVRPFWYFLGIIWLFGLLSGGLHPFALLLVLAGYVVYTVCLASVGLWFSFVSRSTLRATLFTLLGAIVLILGPGFFGKTLGLDAFAGKNPTWDALLAEQALMPGLTLWTLSFHSGDLIGDGPSPLGDPQTFDRISAAVFGLHLYLFLAGALWVSMLTRLRGERQEGRRL